MIQQNLGGDPRLFNAKKFFMASGRVYYLHLTNEVSLI